MLRKRWQKGMLNSNMRPLCLCKLRPAAVNYKKGNKTYYRKLCEVCLHHGKEGYGIPKWYLSGYRQKKHCEKCNFKAETKEQLNVFHIDGDLNNCRPSNLKTICANCQRLLQKTGSKWRQGDLVPDV